MISDTHCQHGVLDMPDGDLLIHAGDWTHRGEQDLTIKFLRWFNAQTHPNKIFIAGNHDFFPERHPDTFRELVKQHAPTCIYLEEESAVVNGYSIYGSPMSPWFHDWAFNRFRGPEIRKHWDNIPANTEILITHGPVLGYGDKLSNYGSEPGKHIGCADLLDTINTRLLDLKLHVSGHIHEGSGVYKHNDSLILINASVLDDRYRMRHAPYVIHLPDKVNPDPK